MESSPNLSNPESGVGSLSRSHIPAVVPSTLISPDIDDSYQPSFTVDNRVDLPVEIESLRWDHLRGASDHHRSIYPREGVHSYFPEEAAKMRGALRRATEESQTVDPREVEFRPNPVHFPHLRRSPTPPAEIAQQSIGTRSAMLEPPQSSVQKTKRKTSDENLFSTFTHFLNNSGDRKDEEMNSKAPPKRQRRRLSRQWRSTSVQETLTVIPNAYASSSMPHDVAEETGSPTPCLASDSLVEEPIPMTTGTSSPECFTKFTSPSIPSENTGSTPASSALSDSPSPFACPECDRSFRTSGQRREHLNRKHVRRFVCLICEKDFNLGADLKRHMKTVHKLDEPGLSGVDSGSYLKCPNAGCKSPDKFWDRKDNLTRHVERCRKALQRSVDVRSPLE
jgi:uncharacterized C2H2 Zn-finger protein